MLTSFASFHSLALCSLGSVLLYQLPVRCCQQETWLCYRCILMSTVYTGAGNPGGLQLPVLCCTSRICTSYSSFCNCVLRSKTYGTLSSERQVASSGSLVLQEHQASRTNQLVPTLCLYYWNLGVLTWVYHEFSPVGWALKLCGMKWSTVSQGFTSETLPCSRVRQL